MLLDQLGSAQGPSRPFVSQIAALHDMVRNTWNKHSPQPCYKAILKVSNDTVSKKHSYAVPG